MVDEYLTLDFFDIPIDGSFLAVSHLLQWKGHNGVVLFDLPPDGNPTSELKHILAEAGGGPLENIDYREGEPFFTVTRMNSPIFITVFPEAWLYKALKLPYVYDAFSKHPFLNKMLIVQQFFLSIKEQSENNIILGLFKDKLEQYKASFFDSFADFFNTNYFENMFLAAFSQMAGEKLLIEKFGEEVVFQVIISNTPMELISRPVDKLRQSFTSLVSFNK